jgi:hypothetical protein
MNHSRLSSMLERNFLNPIYFHQGKFMKISILQLKWLVNQFECMYYQEIPFVCIMRDLTITHNIYFQYYLDIFPSDNQNLRSLPLDNKMTISIWL